MELDAGGWRAADSAALANALVAILQRFYGIEANEIKVDMSDAENRRRSSDRTVVRVTIVKQGSAADTNSIAETLVQSFESGVMHDTLAAFGICHVQRDELGEWTCWINSDTPAGSGDIESVQYILSHVGLDSICSPTARDIAKGARSLPNGIHCRTVAGVGWLSAAQVLQGKCSLWGAQPGVIDHMSGIACRHHFCQQ